MGPLCQSGVHVGDDPTSIPPEDDTRGHTHLAAAHLDLDELEAELQRRTSGALEAAERFELLLSAAVAVGTGLSLPDVLRSIVERACRLVGARYGALGVIGAAGELSQFITVGIDDETRARIGDLPRGRGILGLLVRDPEPLMLRDLSEHPASVGFPPNHPPMRSFLGVPVRARESVFGNLYLCEKEGADEFTATDQELVSALAVAAGVAVENAMLYAAGRRREEWLDAVAAINRSLLAGADVENVLDDIAVRAAPVARADAVRVMLPDDDGANLRVVAAHGDSSGAVVGAVVPIAETAAGEAFRSGTTQTVDDAAKDPRVFQPAIEALHAGAVVYVPLQGTDEVLGVLSIDNTRGGRTFDELDIDVTTSFAHQAALAIELARSRGAHDRMRMLEDRERIGRNLHDTVVQRLFAIGMLLQSTIAERTDPAAERIAKAIDEVDATIKEIRSSIFTLSTPVKVGLRREILDLVDEYADRSDFEPQVVFDGPVDTAIPAGLARNLLACVREAVSNASRHARAEHLYLSLTVADEVVLTVRDDGVGFADGGGRRSGLANLEQRAGSLGGSCEIVSAPGEGTTVTWRSPLPIDDDGARDD